MIQSFRQPAASPTLTPEVFYPESDGEPMADNTEQFDWTVLIKEGLEWLYIECVDIFVAGNLLWYPVEGNNKIRIAPDVLVAIGRPKGPRGSYLQWLEENLPPQVVFEVLSPGNTPAEMQRKFGFYQRYGVEEYYAYDPQGRTLSGWRRAGNVLVEIENMQGWVSPRLGVRFELVEGVLQLYGPDGTPFWSYVDLARQWREEKRRADRQMQRAEREKKRAEQERRRAQQEKLHAEQEKRRAEQLAEQLRKLGVDPQA